MASVNLAEQRSIEFIRKRPSVEDCEKYLKHFEDRGQVLEELKIPSSYQHDGLAEIWSAILVGTLCRANPSCRIRTAGLPEVSPNQAIFSTLPGLTALQLSGVLPDSGEQRVSPYPVLARIFREQGGILEASEGDGLSGSLSQTVVECDPLYPVAQAYQASSREASKRDDQKFEQFLAMRRRAIEKNIGEMGLQPSDLSARDAMINFLVELHTNASKYGRQRFDRQSSPSGIRFMRIAAHIGQKASLVERFAGHESIEGYVDRVTKENSRGFVGVMEASVSDFGLGMLDHFLSSERGLYYREKGRADVLSQLITTRLSSSYHKGAGLGTQKTLLAAQRVRALVSLRTSSFWLVKTFDDDCQIPRTAGSGIGVEFQDSLSKERASVCGTHWQIIWPLLAI